MYTTKLMHHNEDMQVIMQTIKKLHKHSRAVKQLGMPIPEHLYRCLTEAKGMNMLAVLDGEEIVGGIAIADGLYGNSHYPGKSCITGIAAVEPLHQEATFTLINALMHYATDLGADWLILDTEQGEHDVLTKGVRLR